MMPDYLTKTGAEILAAIIKDYWLQLGHEVDVSVVSIAQKNSALRAAYSVSSDLCKTAAPKTWKQGMQV